MNDPDDYYHGQPRINQDVELLLQNGYTGQYYKDGVLQQNANKR